MDLQKLTVSRTVERFFNSGRKDASFNWRELLSNTDAILAGGAITSVFTSNKVNDLDFYLRDLSYKDEFVKGLKEAGFELIFTTENALTFKRKVLNRVYTIQLVTRFTGEPLDIFKTFDFTIVCGAYSFKDNEFTLGDNFLIDLAQRKLVYTGGSSFPICAMYRTKKYVDRGFNLPGGTVIHIALHINKLEINTYKELKEQLQGIDTLFLGNVFKEDSFNKEWTMDEFMLEYMDSVLKEMEVDGND
jgi:hypothetical protein